MGANWTESGAVTNAGLSCETRNESPTTHRDSRTIEYTNSVHLIIRLDAGNLQLDLGTYIVFTLPRPF
jgi:hypothetical protein